jgi:hypothetical protein
MFLDLLTRLAHDGFFVRLTRLNVATDDAPVVGKPDLGFVVTQLEEKLA